MGREQRSHQDPASDVVISSAPRRGVRRLRHARGAGSSTVRYLPPPSRPARRHSWRRAEIPTKPPASWCASTGLRKSFARPTARSRNCRTRSAGSRRRCRSSARTSNSASAIALAARRQTPTSPKRPWPLTSRASLRGQEGRTRSIPTPIRTRLERRGRWERLRRAPRSCANRPRLGARAACPRRSARTRQRTAAPPATSGPTSSALGSRCSISRVSSLMPRCSLSGGAISGGGDRVQGVSRRQSGASPDSGRDLLHRRDLSSALASPRGRRTISQGHDRLFQILAGAGKHGAAGTNARGARQFRPGLRDAKRIRQALPDGFRLGEEARRA